MRLFASVFVALVPLLSSCDLSERVIEVGPTDGGGGVAGTAGMAGAGGAAGSSGSAGAGGTGGGSACVVQLRAGEGHTCARKSGGTVWCWGMNDSGQLGDGTSGSPKATPVQVAALGTATAEIAAGKRHTCARKTDGTVWCWGHNEYGQLGDETTGAPKPAPVQVGGIGASTVEIATGSDFSCARKTDGTLWCWGRNNLGQLGRGSESPSEPTPAQIAALGTNVAGVAAGLSHACARLTDGTVWCWGNNVYGQVGDGTFDDRSSPVQVGALGSTVTQLALGMQHSCVRTGGSAIRCWGRNHHGQLGSGSVGINQPTPVDLTGASSGELVLGGHDSCVRKNAASSCWGANEYGQVGDGTTDTPKSSPVAVTVAAGSIAELGLGWQHGCAHLADGTTRCWGRNDVGQLGDGTTDGQACADSVCKPKAAKVALGCL